MGSVFANQSDRAGHLHARIGRQRGTEARKGKRDGNRNLQKLTPAATPMWSAVATPLDLTVRK